MPHRFLARLEELRRLRDDLERVKSNAEWLHAQLTSQIENIETEIERDLSPSPRRKVRRALRRIS